MARHHRSLGIHSPSHRAATSAGLKARKKEEMGGRPRWGYDEQGNLTSSAWLLVRERELHETSYRKLASKYGCSKDTANRLCWEKLGRGFPAPEQSIESPEQNFRPNEFPAQTEF